MKLCHAKASRSPSRFSALLPTRTPVTDRRPRRKMRSWRQYSGPNGGRTLDLGPTRPRSRAETAHSTQIGSAWRTDSNSRIRSPRWHPNSGNLVSTGARERRGAVAPTCRGTRGNPPRVCRGDLPHRPRVVQRRAGFDRGGRGATRHDPRRAPALRDAGRWRPTRPLDPPQQRQRALFERRDPPVPRRRPVPPLGNGFEFSGTERQGPGGRRVSGSSAPATPRSAGSRLRRRRRSCRTAGWPRSPLRATPPR